MELIVKTINGNSHKIKFSDKTIVEDLINEVARQTGILF
jgi:hypothetical protein